MASVVVTLKIMPLSPEVDLKHIEKLAEAKIDAFLGESGQKKIELEPVAFGLKALKILFVMDEAIGSTESLEEDIATIEGVNSVDVTDVRRAIG